MDSLNQLSNVTRSGTLTVAGKAGQGVPPVSVTVNGQSASLYADRMFARAGFSLADGTNSFTAIATDSTPASVTNDLSVWLPATATFQYDSNGNLLSDGQWGRTYDDENQLISEVLTNACKSEYTYDGKRRLRISRDYAWQGGAWVLTNEVRRIYDGMLVIQERNSSNVPQVTYTRGKDLSGSLSGAGGIGGLLARSQHSTTTGTPTTHAFYHADGNGNITLMVNAQQAIVAGYTYDPYGNETGRSGSLADANLYRFSSKEFRPTSGIYYYGYRFYMPKLQRWVNRDPIEESGGLNQYAFVRNTPSDNFDALGLYGNPVVGPDGTVYPYQPWNPVTPKPAFCPPWQKAVIDWDCVQKNFSLVNGNIQVTLTVIGVSTTAYVVVQTCQGLLKVVGQYIIAINVGWKFGTALGAPIGCQTCVPK